MASSISRAVSSSAGSCVGAGGGPIVPAAGGFGDVPPQPQGAEPPPADCNIATQSPCYQKCQEDYVEAAIACAKIAGEAQRKSCDASVYEAYTRCREDCQKKSNTDCDDKYQDCVDNGPKSCLDQEGGKTLCNRCWERCNAGDSPSARCKKCKF